MVRLILRSEQAYLGESVLHRLGVLIQTAVLSAVILTGCGGSSNSGSVGILSVLSVSKAEKPFLRNADTIRQPCRQNTNRPKIFPATDGTKCTRVVLA